MQQSYLMLFSHVPSTYIPTLIALGVGGVEHMGKPLQRDCCVAVSILCGVICFDRVEPPCWGASECCVRTTVRVLRVHDAHQQ